MIPMDTSIIVNKILNNTPRTQHASVAATLRLVGNQQFTMMAQQIWEHIEPGCTTKANEAYQKLLREHQYLQVHGEEEIAKIQPQVTIPSSLNSRSRVADLKKFAKQIGCHVSGTKEVLWDNIFSKVQLEEEAAEGKRENLRRKREHPPALPRCFLSQEQKEYEIRQMQQTRITATRAKKEYLLGEADLHTLPCTLARNPHYRSAAPMRLYRLADVEKKFFEKHGNVEQQEAVRQKRADTTAKRKRTIQSKEESFSSRLEEEGVDISILTVYAPHLASLGHSERALRQVCSAWNRLVNLRTALTAHGCDLRDDSRLCCGYIAHNEGSVEYIAGMMQEMKFFFQQTDYADIRERIVDDLVDQIRGYGERIDWDDTNHEASQLAKREAVNEWLKSHSPEECPDFPRRFLH